MNEAQNVILIIDDSEENRYTFSRYLRGDKFEIWTAATGEEGLALARKNPSLIMLDIQLPDTSGYELCRILKSDPATASIPILHTSATYTESSDRAFGLEGGADGYLTQPIDAHELAATVQALLRVRAAENAARNLASLWQTTFDSISDGLCVVNPAGAVERFNRSFVALFSHYSIEPGIPFFSILKSVYDHPEKDFSGLTFPLDLRIHGRWYRVANDPLKDEEGNPAGNAWVFSDIDSIREAEIKLQNINQELETRVAERTAALQDAVQQMEQFSYAVSHDLRAPLRAMQGYSNALLEDYGESMPGEGVNYLHRIADNATRLDKMIVDVLTFTRISKATPALEPLSLAGVVADVIEHYPGLKSPQAKITVEVDGSVMANESGLTQAISNLLGNAIKFVSPGVIPAIRIRSEEREADIRIWVEDNGIGIAPEYQKRLFGMFERVLPSSEYEGTGVGLAIARKVVERMKGSVGMESDGMNGSKFWIQLRKAEEPE